MEFYGDKPDGYSSVIHVWHRDDKNDFQFSRIEVFRDADPRNFTPMG